MASASERLDLLTNAIATGAESPGAIGGNYAFVVSGTFAGATVQLQLLGMDGVTWTDLANGAFTAAGSYPVILPRGAHARAFITAGPPSGMYAALVRCPPG